MIFAAKDVAKINCIPESHFTFRFNYNDYLTTLEENHFTLRLNNCLMHYPIIPNTKVKYTAWKGNLLVKKNKQTFSYFMDHQT